MSKFSEKAAATTTNMTVFDGRGGDELKKIANRLLKTLSLTPEQVEDYFDAFTMFPLDRNKCISADSIKSFYENAGLDLSMDDCAIAMKAFTGNDLTFSLGFEAYVINMERWAKKEIHTKGIMNTAYDVFSDDSDRGLSPERFKQMLKSLKGPPLSEEDILKVVQHINVYCGDDDYGFV